jgi:pimeloyl-ACP methyl ester carboxylesterase
MKTWILLRGLARESGHWGRFIAQFQTAQPGSRVLALDLPGNGHLHAQPSPTRIPTMVDHCRGELQAQQITGPVHVLAMSLGAMVAVAWANEHPQEVAAQVLVNTSLRPFSPFYQRLRPRNYGLLLRLALGGVSAEDWERSILRITSQGQHPEVVAQWLAMRQQHPVARRNALRQLLAAARYRAPTQPPPVPSLLLASPQDALVAVACSRSLARHWGCALHEHPWAGHDLPLDDGAWVAERVARWLPSLPQA